jgi:hypothetical protein
MLMHTDKLMEWEREHYTDTRRLIPGRDIDDRWRHMDEPRVVVATRGLRFIPSLLPDFPCNGSIMVPSFDLWHRHLSETHAGVCLVPGPVVVLKIRSAGGFGSIHPPPPPIRVPGVPIPNPDANSSAVQRKSPRDHAEGESGIHLI